MRSFFICSALLLSTVLLKAQDTVYARTVIKFLTSEKCFGRGYVRNGLHAAQMYIGSELRKEKVNPLFVKTMFAQDYYQEFKFNVNTFPGKMQVAVDGQTLKAGKDFIVYSDSKGVSGHFNMTKRDSVTYLAPLTASLVVSLKDKLTFSVDTDVKGRCNIQILNKKKRFNNIKVIDANIENVLMPNYPSNNIGAYIPGTKNNDTMIVFSAHYDHLGGMGMNTFFPGANDNASGVSMLLNLIKYYKANPPAYKTVFVFFAGEEAGLLGSKYFSESNAVDLKKIKFLVNLDLLGTGDEGIMVVNGAIHEREYSLLNRINDGRGYVKEIHKRGKAANSDHYWFTEAGVPCFFIYTMGGIKAYHDVYDVEKTLPLTDYVDVFKLITEFVNKL